MTERKPSRRRVLAGGVTAVGLLAAPAKVLSQAPAADAIMPALRDIKVMKDDPVVVEAQAVEIKARYQKIFGV